MANGDFKKLLSRMFAIYLNQCLFKNGQISVMVSSEKANVQILIVLCSNTTMQKKTNKKSWIRKNTGKKDTKVLVMAVSRLQLSGNFLVSPAIFLWWAYITLIIEIVCTLPL